MNTLRIFALSWILLFTAGSFKNEAHAQSYTSLSYQDFYNELSPYGEWLYDDEYGYVWMPDVGPDFRPYYTNGYWAYTDYGNTWISDYDWGWAAFHYGRWTYDRYYGWLWIPGTEWAPAWVSWRSANDYYGWAPLGPGININVNLNLIPLDWWMFISPNYMYDRSFYRYCNNDWGFRRNIYRRTRIINYTYIDNRTTYYFGPRGEDFYRRTGRRPGMFQLSVTTRRGNHRMTSGNRISVYRPDIRRTPQARPAQPMRIDRGIARRPESFSGSMEHAAGRMQILRESPRYRNNDPNLRRPDMRNEEFRNDFRNEQSPNGRLDERGVDGPSRFNRTPPRDPSPANPRTPMNPRTEPRRDLRDIREEPAPGFDRQEQQDRQRLFREQQIERQNRQQEMQQQADPQRIFREQQIEQQRRQRDIQQQRMPQNAEQQRMFPDRQMEQPRRQRESPQRMPQDAEPQRQRDFQPRQNMPQQERRYSEPQRPDGMPRFQR